MYSSFDISKKILKLAQEEGLGVDPMKLLKLVYIMHGWYLGFYNKPLINDPIQAWKFGPVIPDLYHNVKQYGSENVELEFMEIFSDKELEKQDEDFVKAIWKAYKNKDGLQLSSMTHQEGTPWSKSYIPGVPSIQIPNELIREHYLDKIEAIKSRTIQQQPV